LSNSTFRGWRVFLNSPTKCLGEIWRTRQKFRQTFKVTRV
jgi:hypothetical protein